MPKKIEVTREDRVQTRLYTSQGLHLIDQATMTPQEVPSTLEDFEAPPTTSDPTSFDPSFDPSPSNPTSSVSAPNTRIISLSQEDFDGLNDLLNSLERRLSETESKLYEQHAINKGARKDIQYLEDQLQEHNRSVDLHSPPQAPSLHPSPAQPTSSYANPLFPHLSNVPLTQPPCDLPPGDVRPIQPSHLQPSAQLLPSINILDAAQISSPATTSYAVPRHPNANPLPSTPLDAAHIASSTPPTYAAPMYHMAKSYLAKLQQTAPAYYSSLPAHSAPPFSPPPHQPAYSASPYAVPTAYSPSMPMPSSYLPSFATAAPAVFDGEPNSSYNAESFITAMEDFRALHPQYTDTQCIFIAASRFKAASPAKLWWENLRLAAPINVEGFRSPFPSFSAFTTSFRKQFESPNLRRMLYAELTSLYCINRDIPAYASKFRNLLIKLRAAGAPVPYDQAEHEFYRGLPRDTIPDKDFRDEDEMINYVVHKYGNKFVNSKMPSKLPTSSYPARPYGRYNAMDDEIRCAYNQNPFEPLEEEQFEEDPPEHQESEDPTLAAFNPSFKRGGKSFSRGRGPARAPLRPPSQKPAFSSPSTSKPTTTATPPPPSDPCPRCTKTGHWARECPNPIRSTRLYPLPSHTNSTQRLNK